MSSFNENYTSRSSLRARILHRPSYVFSSRNRRIWVSRKGAWQVSDVLMHFRFVLIRVQFPEVILSIPEFYFCIFSGTVTAEAMRYLSSTIRCFFDSIINETAPTTLRYGFWWELYHSTSPSGGVGGGVSKSSGSYGKGWSSTMLPSILGWLGWSWKGGSPMRRRARTWRILSGRDPTHCSNCSRTY